MKILILFFMCILTFLNYLVGSYFINAFNLTGISSAFFWSIHLIATSIMIATPFVYRLHPVKSPGFFYNALQWIGYILFGIYSVLIIFIALNLSGFVLYDLLSSKNIQDKLHIKFIFALLILGTTAFIAIVGFYQATKKPTIKKIKIKIPELPLEFEGLKIVQMSDIHVGQTIKADYVELLVNMSNEISPDIVVLTGDLTDGSHLQLRDELVAFENIKAPLGKFMIPGNHEYYWGVEAWINYWKEIGFSTLLNEHKVIEKNNSKIVMAGVHDYSVTRMGLGFTTSPQDSLIGSPQDAVKILLAHQPRSVYEASKAGFDLQLSGHTHSGQYFPYNILIYLFQPYVKGLNLYKKTWIYVNQGTGYWGPPSRFGVPPEITVIELTKGVAV
ncbi:MAG: metallophosphoesterase [Bacteriovorax sp.]|nr:metallophosphoesterase [Bacteriovorax sp.]